MEHAISIIGIMLIVQSICLLGLIFEIGKTLKELEKNVVQDDHKDV